MDEKDLQTLVRTVLKIDARYLTLINRDDLWVLIESAVKHQTITLAKGCELLGIPVDKGRLVFSRLAEDA